MVGTSVSGQMLFMGALFTRVMAMRADLGLLDGVLLAAQLALLLNTLMLCLPLVSFFRRLTHLNLTASVVG
jgi:hypothetical protein